MVKTLRQFALLLLLVFGTWFALSRIDFRSLFKVEEFTKENERKLGNVILSTVTASHEELESDTVRSCIDSIKHRLCAANGIEDTSIAVHIILIDNVNAFALPDRHL